MLFSQQLQSVSAQGSTHQGLVDDVGTRALQTVRVGESAGKINAGSGSVLVGYQAGAAATAMSQSVVLGYQSARDATRLDGAVFVGAFTGTQATASTETTVVGYRAGELMRGTTQSVGVGAYTLRESTAIASTAVGYRSMERALDAGYNTAVGAESMQNIRSGDFNTAHGYQSMRAAFTTTESTAVGAYSGYSNTSGRGITAVGFRAAEALTDGAYIVAIGAYSMQRAAAASNAVALGAFVASNATNVDGSVLIGGGAAADATSLTHSVVVGASAAAHLGGASNVVVGAGAMGTATATAHATVAIGPGIAPRFATGSNNVFVGAGADVFSPTTDFGISIGTVAAQTSSHSISIGSNIQNERMGSILVGATLQSDTDNSVLVGNTMNIKSVIFFKDPLLASFSNAVATDATNKLGTCNIDYTDLLVDQRRDVFDVAQAGYVSSNTVNNLRLPIEVAGSPASFDLRQHVPDGAYVLLAGTVVPFLDALGTSPLASKNALLATINTSNVALTADPTLPTDSNAALFVENWSFPLAFSKNATANVWGTGASAATYPYHIPKRAALPIATGVNAAIATPRTAWTPPNITAFTDGIRIDDKSGVTVVYDACNIPATGTWDPDARAFVPAPEALFAAEHVLSLTATLQIRAGDAAAAPIGLATPTTSFKLLPLPHVIVPNALTHIETSLRLTRDVVAVAPPTALGVRITHIDSNLVLQSGGSTYTSNQIDAMVAANIDAYPDSMAAPLLAAAVGTFNAAVLSNVVATSNVASPIIVNVRAGIRNIDVTIDTLASVAIDLAIVKSNVDDLFPRLAPAVVAAPTVAAIARDIAAFYHTSNAVASWVASYDPTKTTYAPHTNTIVAGIDAIATYELPSPLIRNSTSLSNLVALIPGITAAAAAYDVERTAFYETLLPSLSNAARTAFVETTSNAFDKYHTWWDKYRVAPRLFLTYNDVLAGTATLVRTGAGALSPLSMRVGSTDVTVPLNAPLTASTLWCNVDPLQHVSLAASNVVGAGHAAALSLPPSTRIVIEPFQYGIVDPVASNYWPTHPWQNDDAATLVHAAGQSQVVRTRIVRAPTFATIDYAPIRFPPSVTSTYTGPVQTSSVVVTTPLEQTTTTNTSNLFNGALTVARNTTTAAVSAYHAATGLVDTSCNLVSTSNISSSASGMDVTTYTYTTSNIVYGFDGSGALQVDVTGPVVISNAATGQASNATITDDWLIEGRRRAAYNSNLTIWEGESNVVNYSTVHLGEDQFIYSTSDVIPDVRSNLELLPPEGASVATTTIARLYLTSNIDRVEAFVPWSTTTSWAEPTTQPEKNSVSITTGSEAFVASNVGPVAAWSLSNDRIWVSLERLGSATLVASGGVIGSGMARDLAWTQRTASAAPALPQDVPTVTLAFDALFRASTTFLRTIADTAHTHIHWLSTGDGRIVAGDRVTTSVALSLLEMAYYTPNAPSWSDMTGAKQDTWYVYFTGASGVPSSIVRVPLAWVAMDVHSHAHVMNTGLAAFASGALTPRTLHPGGGGIDVVGIAPGWSLCNANSLINPTLEVPVHVTYAGVASGAWSVTPTTPGAVAIDGELAYKVGAVDHALPLRSYIHDAFPTLAHMAASRWTLREIGVAPLASVVEGPAFDAMLHAYERTRQVASAEIVVEVLGEAPAIFMDPTTSNVRTTTLAGIVGAGGPLRRVPFVPMALSNEMVNMRFAFGGRASPTVDLALSNHIARVGAATADTTRRAVAGRTINVTKGLWLSPGLATDGYAWTPTTSILPYNIAAPSSSFTMSLARLSGSYAESTTVRTFIGLPSSVPPAWSALALSLTCDQADHVTLTAVASCVSYISDSVRDVIFYVDTPPTHGMLVALPSGRPAARFTLDDLATTAYQHLGSGSLGDAFKLRVASGPYDVSAATLTVSVTARAMPRITLNRRQYIYESTSNVAIAQRPWSPANFAITGAGHVHVLATTGLVPATNTFATAAVGAGTATYGLSPTALSAGAPLALTLSVNATAAAGYSNDLAAHHPFYLPLFVQTFEARLNTFQSSNVRDTAQPRSTQVLEYSFLPNAGVEKFANHAVGVYIEMMPTQPFLDADVPSAEARRQIAPLRDFKAVLEATDAAGAALFRVALTKRTATYTSGTVTTVFPIPDAMALDFDVFNGIYFVNNDKNNGNDASLYLKYNLKDVQAVNETRNLFFGANVPAVPLDTIARIRWSTDLTDVAMNHASGDAGPVAPANLTTLFDLSNYSTTLFLRNFEVLASTYMTSFDTSAEQESPYDNATYNIACGKDIQVLGVNNIAIGSSFTTSGKNSIIIGNKIGTTNNTAGTNEIYESIVIGNDSFANAFVRDMIAIGTNNFNDLYLSPTPAVNDFLARQPILIGNGIGRDKLDFHINVGNAFLKTAVGGEQIYLGAGEPVGIGFASNVALDATGDRLVVNGGVRATDVTLTGGTRVAASTVGVIPEFSVISLKNELNSVPVVGLSEGVADSNVFGVWSSNAVVVAGRARVRVTGAVAMGNLLRSSATAGVAEAATALRTNATLGKALSSWGGTGEGTVWVAI